jgi:hypothetical protein
MINTFATISGTSCESLAREICGSRVLKRAAGHRHDSKIAPAGLLGRWCSEARCAEALI